MRYHDMEFFVANLGNRLISPQDENRIHNVLHAKVSVTDPLSYGSMDQEDWHRAWDALWLLAKRDSDGFQRPLAVILPQAPDVVVEALVSYREKFGQWPLILHIYPQLIQAVDYEEQYRPLLEREEAFYV